MKWNVVLCNLSNEYVWVNVKLDYKWAKFFTFKVERPYNIFKNVIEFLSTDDNDDQEEE